VDHDQRFKTLIREFFAEFFRLFFLEWAGWFDFDSVEWLQQEVFLDPPQGRRRSLDLVAKLRANRPLTPGQAPADGKTWLALIHVEIESADTVEPLRGTVFDYYKQLRNRHELPVLPIALYLRVGLDGVGWDVYEESFGGRRLVQFHFAYIGLPALDAEQYARGENLLGVALSVLMRVPEERRAELAAQVLQRVAQSGENSYRKFLLAECAFAYSGLTEEQRREFQRLLDSEPYREARAMTTTFFEQGIQQGIEKGIEKGIAQGIEKGQRRMLLLQLEKRFGPLSPPVLQRLEALTPQQVEEKLVAFVTAGSLAELGLE
jgi:Domain of unknown function (DUF4351)